MKKGITRVPAPHDLGAIFPYIMKRRCDSQVFYNVDLNVEPLMIYIEENQNCTFFQGILLALVKTMRARPFLNRFVMGRRLYQREDLDVSFIAKRSYTDDGGETTIKLRIKPEDDDSAVISKITNDIAAAREGQDTGEDVVISLLLKLPRILLRAVISLLIFLDFYMIFPKDLEKVDPLHCSAFVANLGSVGIDAPFHHLYEWGTCSLFVAIGKIGPKPVTDHGGNLIVTNMVELKITLDERIADGYYFARSFDLFKHYVENPEMLFDSAGNSNKAGEF